MNRFIKRGAVLFGALLALGVAAGLYTKTQPSSLENHASIVDQFGTLHTLDAMISQQALAARHGLAPHYDPLTKSGQQFTSRLAVLARELEARSAEDPALRAALSELAAAAKQRAASIEHFKTQNSVLKNSLYYLPLAGQQVTNEIEQHSAQAGLAQPLAITAGVSKLVQMTLAQNLLGSREDTAKVGKQIDLLRKLEADVPEAARDRYRLLLAHAGAASRLQQVVDPIVRNEVMGAPVNAKLSGVERIYTEDFEAALGEANRYRSILYGWSVLLLFALVVAAVKLRSVYANLESLVQERTNKLDAALKELWGEMELAKKIQTALVPSQLSLHDCEVAAVMRPADQVGGDYYDVFEVGGTEWVLIGDVSGHGVPAGLVMMMCQTAVRSVLAAQPDIGPDELLALVNRTLTQNIERLGEDKYMTVSALRHEPDGSFKVAGMHQDLLIYRAASARVEHLHAQGTWLGIASDIRKLNPVRSFKLAPGDTLLLYTDGITEARLNGEMLDVDGLKQTLLEHGTESATGILDGILERLQGYEVKDDVAAIIIKQLAPVRALRETAA